MVAVLKGLKGKSGLEVQCWSGMIPHSCCEFTSQGTAGGKPHFLSVCCPQGNQRLPNDLTWPSVKEGGDAPHSCTMCLFFTGGGGLWLT